MSIASKIISKTKRGSKYAWHDVKAFTGFNERLYRNARGARIICYHGICKKDHLKFNNTFITLEMFEEHLKFYKKYFNVISLEDYYSEHFSEDRFNICISFDDGYKNNYKYVLPFLKKYQLSATFFITAISEMGYDILWNDFLGIVTKYGRGKISYKNEIFYKDQYGKYISAINNEPLVERIRSGTYDLKVEMMQSFSSMDFRSKKDDEDFWQQMTPAEIRELSECEFCTIGSHGYYHNDLAKLSIEDATKEMVHSKSYLESITGKNISALAFPYGTYTRAIIAEAKKAGYDKLLALDFRFKEDVSDFAMRERFTVNPYISASNQMIASITGKYF